MIWLTYLTNIIITELIKYIVAIIGNTAKGIININYKAIIEVFIEIYFKVIARRNTMSIRSYLVLLALLLKSFTPLY